jgi:signal transduction histidine kinase
VAALEKHAASLRARHGLEVEIDLGEEPALPLGAKEALYRIAQESIHNTVKHAQARRVRLRLSATTGETVLEIEDDGVGFDPSGAFPGHLGLRSMRERVDQHRGTMDLTSAPGDGTCIRVRFPV